MGSTTVCPYRIFRLQASYLSATSHTGRKSCRVKSLHMKRFCFYFSKRTFLLHGDIQTAVKMVLIPQSYSTNKVRIFRPESIYENCRLCRTVFVLFILCRGIFIEYWVHPLLHKNRNRFIVVPKTISHPSNVDQLIDHSLFMCWNFSTIYEGQEPSRNGVVRRAKLQSLAELVPWIDSRAP